MDTTFAAKEKTREDKRRQEKPNNTGNVEEKQSKIYAPKTPFPCEIENEKDK